MSAAEARAALEAVDSPDVNDRIAAVLATGRRHIEATFFLADLQRAFFVASRNPLEMDEAALRAALGARGVLPPPRGGAQGV